MEDLGLIVSTGRTGTQFFSYFINANTRNAICLHEPTPSRRFKFLSNLYLDGRVGGRFVARHYVQCRRKSWKAARERYYIESNNFLFGCLQPLVRHFSSVKLMHVVRAPTAYIRSHLKHGFWLGIKKWTAQYVPYWLEKIALAPEDRANPVRILAHRWVYVNEVIASRSAGADYLLVRFEDVFSPDPSCARTAIDSIRAFFDLHISAPDKTAALLRHKQNIGRRSNAAVRIRAEDERYIGRVCGRLAREYEYPVPE
jgi:hypothetical protein